MSLPDDIPNGSAFKFLKINYHLQSYWLSFTKAVRWLTLSR